MSDFKSRIQMWANLEQQSLANTNNPQPGNAPSKSSTNNSPNGSPASSRRASGDNLNQNNQNQNSLRALNRSPIPGSGGDDQQGKVAPGKLTPLHTRQASWSNNNNNVAPPTSNPSGIKSVKTVSSTADSSDLQRRFDQLTLDHHLALSYLIEAETRKIWYDEGVLDDLDHDHVSAAGSNNGVLISMFGGNIGRTGSSSSNSNGILRRPSSDDEESIATAYGPGPGSAVFGNPVLVASSTNPPKVAQQNQYLQQQQQQQQSSMAKSTVTTTTTTISTSVISSQHQHLLSPTVQSPTTATALALHRQSFAASATTPSLITTMDTLSKLLDQSTLDEHLLLSYAHDLAALSKEMNDVNRQLRSKRQSLDLSNNNKANSVSGDEHIPMTPDGRPTLLATFAHHLNELKSQFERAKEFEKRLFDAEARLRARDQYLQNTIMDTARRVQELEGLTADLESQNEELRLELKRAKQDRDDLELELGDLEDDHFVLQNQMTDASGLISLLAAPTLSAAVAQPFPTTFNSAADAIAAINQMRSRDRSVSDVTISTVSSFVGAPQQQQQQQQQQYQQGSTAGVSVGSGMMGVNGMGIMIPGSRTSPDPAVAAESAVRTLSLSNRLAYATLIATTQSETISELEDLLKRKDDAIELLVGRNAEIAMKGEQVEVEGATKDRVLEELKARVAMLEAERTAEVLRRRVEVSAAAAAGVAAVGGGKRYSVDTAALDKVERPPSSNSIATSHSHKSVAGGAASTASDLAAAAGAQAKQEEMLQLMHELHGQQLLEAMDPLMAIVGGSADGVASQGQPQSRGKTPTGAMPPASYVPGSGRRPQNMMNGQVSSTPDALKSLDTLLDSAAANVNAAGAQGFQPGVSSDTASTGYPSSAGLESSGINSLSSRGSLGYIPPTVAPGNPFARFANPMSPTVMPSPGNGMPPAPWLDNQRPSSPTVMMAPPPTRGDSVGGSGGINVMANPFLSGANINPMILSQLANMNQQQQQQQQQNLPAPGAGIIPLPVSAGASGQPFVNPFSGGFPSPQQQQQLANRMTTIAAYQQQQQQQQQQQIRASMAAPPAPRGPAPTGALPPPPSGPLPMPPMQMQMQNPMMMMMQNSNGPMSNPPKMPLPPPPSAQGVQQQQQPQGQPGQPGQDQQQQQFDHIRFAEQMFSSS
ncbi:hypothetical protein HDU76_012723 [Blyttiomyces sp. JEL0837]|nr:hypothetical protein HDU76_012723 [Blyttiomyces sp. JEL0837]